MDRGKNRTKFSKEPHKGIRRESSMPLLFLGMLIISIAGHFAIGDHWVEIIINHLGGLSIVGLFACLTGYIAKRKAYDYRKGFLLSFFLPIILGFISFLLIFFQKSFVYCGGGVVLASSVVIVIIYTLIKRRDISKQVDPVK